MNSTTIAFQSKWSELSNLYPCKFNLEGVTYNSVEQYFQAQKAQFMSDDTAQKLIMDETDPVKTKSLGDRVRV